jgi:Calx-beta domain
MEKHFFRVSAAVFCALLAVTAVADDAACTLTASNTGPYSSGSTISLSASGDPSSVYAWSGPNGFTSDQQNPIIATADVSQAGTYNVTSNGCSAATAVVVSQPTINIDNISGSTGPKGSTTQFVFHVTLSAPSSQKVSVEFYTSNSTALAGKDYQYTTGTVVFQNGQTEQDVAVNVYGTRSNLQKAFLLNLYEPENASIRTLFGYPVSGGGVILAK